MSQKHQNMRMHCIAPLKLWCFNDFNSLNTLSFFFYTVIFLLVVSETTSQYHSKRSNLYQQSEVDLGLLHVAAALEPLSCHGLEIIYISRAQLSLHTIRHTETTLTACVLLLFWKLSENSHKKPRCCTFLRTVAKCRAATALNCTWVLIFSYRSSRSQMFFKFKTTFLIEHLRWLLLLLWVLLNFSERHRATAYGCNTFMMEVPTV